HYLAQAADLAPGDELIIANFLLAAQRSGRGELVRDATSRMGDPDKREKMEKFLLEWRPNAVRNHSETSTVVNDWERTSDAPFNRSETVEVDDAEQKPRDRHIPLR